MKNKQMWLAALLGLFGAGGAWAADVTVTTIPWSGSFFLDTRVTKQINTKAELKLIQPIVVKTRDTVVTETHPVTGLKTELERSSSSADGSGLIEWAPRESGTWKLANSKGGTATFEVARDLFHGAENGLSADTAYEITTLDVFLALLEDTSADIGVNTYVKIPASSDLTSADLHDIYHATSDGTAVGFFPVEGKAGVYKIEEGVQPYDGKWLDATSVADIDSATLESTGSASVELTFRLDTRDQSTAETARGFTALPTSATTGENALWPFTFESGEVASITVYSLTDGTTQSLRGSTAGRPDKSGQVAWYPEKGGLYRATLSGKNAFFDFPVSVADLEGSGTEADPYITVSTNSLMMLVADAGSFTVDSTCIRGLGRNNILATLSAVLGTGYGVETVDEDAGIYKIVATDGMPAGGGKPSYTVTKDFKVDGQDKTGIIQVSSLASLMNLTYYGNAPDYTLNGLGEATITTQYYAGFDSEGELTSSAAETYTGMGEVAFTPTEKGLYVLTHTNGSETTLSAKFQVGESGGEALPDSYEGEVATAEAFKSVLDTIGYTTVSMTLSDDIILGDAEAGALEIPATIGNLEIDLAGNTISGLDGVADVHGALAAFKILGTNTVVTIVDSVGGGVLKGGDGINGDSLHNAGEGAVAIAFPEKFAGTVTVKASAKVVGGNGGSVTIESVAKNGAAGGKALSFGADSQATITVKSGAQVIGGNGGSSVSRDGGAGAAAIAVADAVEDISNLDITVEEGAVVKGGLGGDAGVLGKAGSGGVAVQGTATVDGDEEAALQGGEAGSYVVNSQEDLDILAENYASKADGNEINIKIGEDAAGEDLTIDSKIESANIDLNGNSVASITVNGETETTIGDNSGSETPGSVGTVTAAGGASVDVNGGSVGTVEADNGTSVNVNGGSVTNVSADNGTNVNVNGGSVTKVEAGDDTSVALNGGTTETITDTATTNHPTVVVDPVVETPPTVPATAVSATYINNESHTIAAAGAYILNGNIDSTLEVGYAVTIDLNGYTITGTSGASEAEDGQSAIKPTAAVAITVTGEGTLTGGNGADGASTHGAGAEAVGSFEGATVTVADTVTQVKGDDGFASDNMPTIKIVKMVQRYPWNGYVDIDYTLTGDNFANISIELAFTNADGDSQTAQKWIVEPTVEAGTHRMTWNAAAEFATNYVSKDVKVTVKLVRKVVAE